MLEVDDLQEQLGLGDFPVDYSPSRNLSPGQLVLVVTDPVSRNLELYRWGLIPGWAKDPRVGYRMFNARSETVDQKPSFRVPFLRRRCLIPADGFYEWKLDGGRKYPFLFTLNAKMAFTFAGLWESWRDREGNETRSCTIITTEPNELVKQYHDRMPVIFTGEEKWRWLEETSPADLKVMLRPIDAGLMEQPIRIEKLTV